ncbi:MAG: fibrobacter succinogenes major paralogous domain-containing protein [Flavobacteriales bacterium]|nr:fibrobacter succinogenes major paralogous domain-containing protein [Flavobacteriales bacterium]
MNTKKLMIVGGIVLLFGCSESSNSHATTEPAAHLESVTIGNQTWTTQNLNVDTFQNGDKIPEAKTSEEWNEKSQNKEPVWCHYNFDAVNDSLHGKLYNWYAITDDRKLAPKGWHVATKEDWEELIKFSGNGTDAAMKLKSKSGWYDPTNDPDTSGTDEFGFKAYPTGELHTDGVFSSINSLGVWWTSSTCTESVGYGKIKDDYAWDVVFLFSSSMKPKVQVFPKKGSGGARCVKNI